MSRFTRILVPFDFSPFSEQALEYGCAFASGTQSVLYLLHIVHDFEDIGGHDRGSGVPDAAQYFRGVQESAADALAKIPLDAAQGVTIFRQTLVGSPWKRIVEFAKSQAIDLVSIGTHGRHGISRFLLGSVAEKVVQHAPCSVLVVRQGEREFVRDNQSTPKRVLVPVDFSAFSNEAVNEGAALAAQFEAQFHLLHVVEDNSPSVSAVALAHPVFRSYVQELVSQGQLQLDAITLPSNLASKSVYRSSMIGEPIAKINSYAKENLIDLIVMSTHGRTGPSHWMLGSVAERVVRSAPCPVLVIPSRNSPPAA